MAGLCCAAGLILQFLVLTVEKIVNSRPKGISFVGNFLFLIFARPLYVVGFCLFFLPIVVQNEATKPLRQFLSNKYWLPFSRLTYGVFLCN
mmetsp:Transcript_4385/g.7426  ORF Transcript_4385/g.7426 Transcript_4385/m.7426 type:complete len:91 (-) Transcript_4385:398-670(-)